ncbi:MAG TPA: hypothetical protein VNO30_41505 [Kofleriaceae bacterium]|nr:hypothetical protein [Kofleriaceae bacterium]
MQTTNTNGCGCPGCTCGGTPARLPEASPASCSPCDTAAFIRPRFFAGQLLTEDDLRALIDYFAMKSRFHNAWLFGDGVVCGLEVQIGPCDGAQLVVAPGYALDCCGNDLVLTCDRTLDLAPMIRDLQARLHGRFECNDPWVDDSRQDVKHYGLYALYAERPEQPVMAYPVADDCDAARCEPTRILEGITFELRPALADDPPTPTAHDRGADLQLDDLGAKIAAIEQRIETAELVRRQLSGSDPNAEVKSSTPTSAAGQQLGELANAVKELVAGRGGGSHTQDEVRELLDRLSPQGGLYPADTSDEPPAQRAASTKLETAISLLRRFLENYKATVINPVCSPCDDRSVLLVHLDVKDGKVTRIDNRVRTYVLAPTTLRYWGAIARPEFAVHGAPQAAGERTAKRRPAPTSAQIAASRPEQASAAELAQLREELASLRTRLDAYDRRGRRSQESPR